MYPNNRRVLLISTANHWKIFMSNFRINWIEKNDVTLPWKFFNFTRPKFCGIFAFLVLASATVKTSVYWISSRYFFILNYFSPPCSIRCLEFLSYELLFIIGNVRNLLPCTEFHPSLYSNLIFGQPFWSDHFLFLNVEFTDSSLKISRTVKKSTKRIIQIQ